MGVATESLFQFNPSKAALVVVDVQNDFCHEKGAFGTHKKSDLTHVQTAVAALRAFIDEWRGRGLPVIFIQTIHSPWTDSPSWLQRMEGKAKDMTICPPGSWGSEFYRVCPQENDCVVVKHRYSAFFETNLDLILRSRGIEHLLIAGVATNVCVETTVGDAFNRNYNVVLIENCCGAFERGEHEAAVHNVGRYFGRVADSNTVLRALKGDTPPGGRL